MRPEGDARWSAANPPGEPPPGLRRLPDARGYRRRCGTGRRAQRRSPFNDKINQPRRPRQFRAMAPTVRSRRRRIRPAARGRRGPDQAGSCPRGAGAGLVTGGPRGRRLHLTSPSLRPFARLLAAGSSPLTGLGLSSGFIARQRPYKLRLRRHASLPQGSAGPRAQPRLRSATAPAVRRGDQRPRAYTSVAGTTVPP